MRRAGVRLALAAALVAVLLAVQRVSAGATSSGCWQETTCSDCANNQECVYCIDSATGSQSCVSNSPATLDQECPLPGSERVEQASQCATTSYCGDDVCDSGETCDCQDCRATAACDPCGDSTCDATNGEDCVTCPADCSSCNTGPYCGDGTCGAAEDTSNCPGDCPDLSVSCGNGVCEPPSEGTASCSQDCVGSVCGDSSCDGDETCDDCPDDCGSCNVCPNDCSGNGSCVGGTCQCDPTHQGSSDCSTTGCPAATCPDGTCAAAASDCSTGCTYVCPNGECATDPAIECTSSTACPVSAPILCPDGQCLNSTRYDTCAAQNDHECDQAATPHRCWDGSCVADAATCPSKCLPTQVRCPDDNRCVPSASDCNGGAGAVCGDATPYRCVDGTCVSRPGACPCPDWMVRCSDGRCTTAATDCVDPDNVRPCPTGTTRCPDSTVCVDASSQCPRPTVCPAPYIRCPTGECVRDDSFCHSPGSCPPNRPLRCADNLRCVANLDQCPQNPECPATRPHLCPSGSCVEATSDCYSPPVCSDPTPLLCPDGVTCTSSSLDNCPTRPTCPNDMRLCADGTCVARIRECPEPRPARCPPNRPVACGPNVPEDCVTDIEHCPTPTTCPPDQVQCWDGRCSSCVQGCTAPRDCPADRPHRCGGSSLCVQGPNHCPSRPRCPRDKPVRCSDNSCASSIERCNIDTCPANKPFRCPEGECASDPDVCAPGPICPAGTVRCPNGVCTQNPGVCGDIDPCPYGMHRCSDGRCADSESVCGSPPSCHADEVRCADGSCRRATAHCPPQPPATCPVSSPARCADGTCRSSVADCPRPRRCPDDRPVRCSNSLTQQCVRDSSECPRNGDENNGSCPVGQFRCSTGSARGVCVSTSSHCPTWTTCPGDSVLCWDNTCARSEEDCAPEPTCAPGKALCEDGTCADQPALCPDPTRPTCPPNSPVLCGDMVCRDVASISECDTATPRCPPGTRRCSDRRCIPHSATCDPGPECPEDSVECYDGSCASDSASCPDPTTRCPADRPVRCPPDARNAEARCVSAADEATVCPPGGPTDTCVTGTRCADGSCRLSCNDVEVDGCPSGTRRCRNQLCLPFSTACDRNPCPADAPVQCDDGLCARSSSLCRPRREDRACQLTSVQWPFVCTDGSCSPTCRPVVPCPPNQPDRCSDGTCRASASECPPPSGGHTPCPSAKPVRCSSGACAETQQDCPVPNGCPSNAEVRCPDGTCVDAVTSCPSVPPRPEPGCSVDRPRRCPSRETCGRCVADLSECEGDQGCPSDRPTLCSDGRCVDPSVDDCSSTTTCSGVLCPPDASGRQRCVDDLNQCLLPNGCPRGQPIQCACTHLIAAGGSNSTCVADASQCGPESSCSTSGEIRCADGSCAPPGRCPPVPPCTDPQRPFLCRGQCVADQAACNARTECPTTRPVRCLDNGDCVRSSFECVRGSRCSSDVPFLCRDGTCASSVRACFDRVSGGQCSSSSDVVCPDGSCAASRDKCDLHNGPPAACRGGQCPDGTCSFTIDSSNHCPSLRTCSSACGDNERCDPLTGQCVQATCLMPARGVPPEECQVFDNEPYRVPRLRLPDCGDDDDCVRPADFSRPFSSIVPVRRRCEPTGRDCVLDLYRGNGAHAGFVRFNTSTVEGHADHHLIVEVSSSPEPPLCLVEQIDPQCTRNQTKEMQEACQQRQEELDEIGCAQRSSSPSLTIQGSDFGTDGVSDVPFDLCLDVGHGDDPADLSLLSRGHVNDEVHAVRVGNSVCWFRLTASLLGHSGTTTRSAMSARGSTEQTVSMSDLSAVATSYLQPVVALPPEVSAPFPLLLIVAVAAAVVAGIGAAVLRVLVFGPPKSKAEQRMEDRAKLAAKEQQQQSDTA